MLYSDRTGTYSDKTTCPRCGAAIRLADVRIFTKPEGPYPKCRQCETPLCVSVVYRRSLMVATLGFACLVPYLIGLGGYVLIAWIPFFVLALLVIPQLVMVVIPPRLEDAYLPKHRTVLRRNVEVFTSIWLYFAFFLLASGGLARLIEGKEAFTEYLSVPLGWFDPVFKVGAKNGSLQTLGIFVTNTLVCAVFAFPFVILLRAVILRARRRAFTQLESTLLIRKMTIATGWSEPVPGRELHPL